MHFVRQPHYPARRVGLEALRRGITTGLPWTNDGSSNGLYQDIRASFPLAGHEAPGSPWRLSGSVG